MDRLAGEQLRLQAAEEIAQYESTDEADLKASAGSFAEFFRW